MKNEKVILVKIYASPIGQLLLGSIDNALCLCDWQTERHCFIINARLQHRLSARYQEGTSDIIETAQAQLEEYFAGKRKKFEVPLLLAGTDFQQSVWKELLRIPYGKTIAYAELAQYIGQPKAVRAVANANRLNPLSVIIPCHRVIGSNHTLTGYGGGLEIKQKLLEWEILHSVS